MPNYKITAEQIDALLPQTQCGDCGYSGCLPYAKAIVNQNEMLDRCIPGGIHVLKKIGKLLENNIDALLPEMEHKQKHPVLAKISESECIGCTKCIKACPVDAIIGAKNQMHVVLKDECTGCGLCADPCPMNCIALVAIPSATYNPEKARKRYNARSHRLRHEKSSLKTISYSDSSSHKKQAILDAIARIKTKRELSKTSYSKSYELKKDK